MDKLALVLCVDPRQKRGKSSNVKEYAEFGQKRSGRVLYCVPMRPQPRWDGRLLSRAAVWCVLGDRWLATIVSNEKVCDTGVVGYGYKAACIMTTRRMVRPGPAVNRDANCGGW